jgi:phospholipase C
MALRDIDTFVIVILENRSFDHMLGYLSLASTATPLAVEGLQDDPVWLSAHGSHVGGDVPIYRLNPVVQAIDDPPHEKATIAMQIDAAASGTAKMDGFVASYLQRNPPPENSTRVMGYYDAAAVPIFDFFASNFAVCDHWFAALPTGTQANRLMAMSGTSSLIDNASLLLPDQELVYDWLTRNAVTWCAYQSGDFLPFFSLMPSWLPEILTSLALAPVSDSGRFRRYDNFRRHWVSNDTMPSVIFIEPEYTDGPNADPNDDHPPTGVAKGQLFLADIYAALVSNPDRWRKTMMIVTYDEHGGFFDHVPPLPITTTVPGFQFATTGVRVPAFVISPQVAPGTVLTEHLDHTSILRLLADRFTPGRDYSAAVAARYPFLVPLQDILPINVPDARAPAIPAASLTALRGLVGAAPIPAAKTTTASATANSQAFHAAAAKAANDHPELVQGPGWSALNGYISRERR